MFANILCMFYLILMMVPYAEADQYFVGPEAYRVLESLCKKITKNYLTFADAM